MSTDPRLAFPVPTPATQEEVDAGISTSKYVSPSTLSEAAGIVTTGDKATALDVDNAVPNKWVDAAVLQGKLVRPPLNRGNLSGAVTLSYSDGPRMYCAANGSPVTLNVSDGTNFDLLTVWITASNGASRSITFDSSICIPSNLGISLPITLPVLNGCRIQFEKHGAKWMLVSFLHDYSGIF